ncbi:hypothetical protein [Staphylococcus hominis]|uniref:hypothetical protein n=1 Tax=Staphylococcus hominis TaxID=1290 RepID=UPI0022E872CC|nr:hypothetical protein [Staphylococcus hominis]
MTLIDLMTDKEIEIWNKLNAAERVGIILSFNLMLVKNGVDRRIVPSVKLNDNRIFINIGVPY